MNENETESGNCQQILSTLKFSRLGMSLLPLRTRGAILPASYRPTQRFRDVVLLGAFSNRRNTALDSNLDHTSLDIQMRPVRFNDMSFYMIVLRSRGDVSTGYPNRFNNRSQSRPLVAVLLTFRAPVSQGRGTSFVY